MSSSVALHHDLTTLDDAEAFQQVLHASHQHPVLIFKHSRTCGISAQAYDEILGLTEQGSLAPVHVVEVLAARGVSQAIARALNIRHESPQLLLVQSGRAVWTASHFRVTAAAARAALERVTEPVPL